MDAHRGSSLTWALPREAGKWQIAREGPKGLMIPEEIFGSLPALQARYPGAVVQHPPPVLPPDLMAS